MDPITITGVTAGQVRDWLARVLPHLGTDDTLPFLMRVQITIGDGYLLAAATDRYSLAVTHLPATTGAGRARFTIDGEWAREMAAELAYHRNLADARAVLVLADGRFSIDLPDFHDDDFEPYFDGEWNTTPAEQDADWIDWEALTRPLLAAPADPDPVPVRADLLARFTTCVPVILDPAAPSALTPIAPGPGLPPLAVHSPGDGRPLLLLGPDFLGLLALYKVRADLRTPADPPSGPHDWHAIWADALGASRAAVPA